MDWKTKEDRSYNMSMIRSKDTVPELLIANELKGRKLYFKRNHSSVLGRPDIVFLRRKIAVFVDSEFWHGHPKLFRMPKSNKVFWRNKIERNRNRDKIVNRSLKKEGWRVIRIWEFEIKKNKEKAVEKILNILKLN